MRASWWPRCSIKNTGTIQWRSNENTDSDSDYFTCPGCGTELYSSWVHAWVGIECDTCGCKFACVDDGIMWDFEEMPKHHEE
jgi:transcription elongation factor Elf1